MILAFGLFLNPFGLRGLQFHPLGDVLPFESTYYTGGLGLGGDNGFPVQYGIVSDVCAPTAGHHCLAYYNLTVQILDGLFCLVVATAFVIILDLSLARRKSNALKPGPRSGLTGQEFD